MMQEATEFTRGNPLLPPPGSAEFPLSALTPATASPFSPASNAQQDVPANPVLQTVIHPRRRKKLIVLCDGTGQDSSGSTAQNPTNITRMSRALAPNAWVKNGAGVYEEWDQIVSYHAGIGTFAGNNALGIMFGEGLSEIVRAAYGFLVSNYLDGDKIYIFGFSRGAYIARAIAGLVAEHGLLTKRGMDNFHAVYEKLYMMAEDHSSPDIMMENGKKTTLDQAGLLPVKPGTVEVIGVFDTVGFHAPIRSFFRRFSSTLYAGDKNEFQNTRLSSNVKYAFHALSLDEQRIPFQTTLFFSPKKVTEQLDEYKRPWSTKLEQVWFSGSHSDVGGGMQDSRLCNISLAWMIDRLESNNLLSFNQTYLVETDQEDARSATNSPPASLTIGKYTAAQVAAPWATIEGPNPNKFTSEDAGITRGLQMTRDAAIHYMVFPLLEIIKFCFVVITIPGSKTSKWWTGHRTPHEYVPIKDYKPDSVADYETFESLHESIKDRVMPPKWPRRYPWSKNVLWRFPYGRGMEWLWIWVDKGWWPCDSLSGWQCKKEGSGGEIPGSAYVKKDVPDLPIAKVGDIEMSLKGRMRFKCVLKPWFPQVPVPPEPWAVPFLHHRSHAQSQQHPNGN